ncbi:hypothetical protein HK097_002648, partial [Rhizophlyctis rosea]
MTQCHRHRILDRGGTTTFGQSYFSACALRSQPVRADVVGPELEMKAVLCVDVDRLKRDEDWDPVLAALRHDSTLKGARFMSSGVNRGQSRHTKASCSHQHKERTARQQPLSAIHISPRVQLLFANTLKDFLTANQRVCQIEIAGIHLQSKHLQLLAKGLVHNKSLQYLSLARTKIVIDEDVAALIPSLKSSRTLVHLNLADCNLTPHGADMISGLLK